MIMEAFKGKHGCKHVVTLNNL